MLCRLDVISVAVDDPQVVVGVDAVRVQFDRLLQRGDRGFSVFLLGFGVGSSGVAGEVDDPERSVETGLGGMLGKRPFDDLLRFAVPAHVQQGQSQVKLRVDVLDGVLDDRSQCFDGTRVVSSLIETLAVIDVGLDYGLVRPTGQQQAPQR